MRRTSLLLMSLLAGPFAACDGTREGAIASDPMSVAFELHAGDWGPAVKLGPQGVGLLNTAALEGCPHESPDGRTLYFASDRDGSIDIWYSHRIGNGDWGTPAKLPPPVNSPANDFCPTALPDGGLLFVSTRSDLPNCGTGTADIYQARPDPAGGWIQPVNLGCTINSPGNEFSPSLVSAGGGMLFFSSDRGGNHAIYVSLRGPGNEWQLPTPVPELNLAGYNSFRPSASQDGRRIVFDSNRPGGEGGLDVWYAHRATPFDSWSTPENAGAGVNSAAAETRASISRDGQRLYFGSTRGGSSDIYVAGRN